MHHGPIDDAAAVARTLEGDTDAFALLVHRHVRVAHAVAKSVVLNDADADDVVQDAFLMAFRKLRFARDPAQFRAWLLRIVRNRAYNVLDYNRVRRHECLTGAERLSSSDDPSVHAERTQLRADIMSAVATLKPMLREVLWLHDVEGFVHAEVAGHLNISELMSRKYLMKARRALRELLSRYRSE